MVKHNFFSRYTYIKHKPSIFTNKILRFTAGRCLDSLALVLAKFPLGVGPTCGSLSAVRAVYFLQAYFVFFMNLF